jgi:hypothetical protein
MHGESYYNFCRDHNHHRDFSGRMPMKMKQSGLCLFQRTAVIGMAMFLPAAVWASDADSWGGRKANPANSSRLIVTNSNQSYGSGNGALLSYELILLGLSVGIGDYFNFTGATAPLPNLEWEDRPILGSLDGAFAFSERARAGGGISYLKPALESGEAFLFARVGADYGSVDRFLSVSVGFGSKEGDITSLSASPVLIVGGSYRIVDHVAVVTENWLITGSIDHAPYSAAGRFYWEAFAFDLGAFLIDGSVGPWLSLAYNL